MFTGIVEEIGTVKTVKSGSKSSQVTISASKVLRDVKLGDSICSNGVCLTVVKFSENEFTVDIMAETVRRSTFKNVSTGMKVNLERALAVGDRLGGHMVSGHIDGTGIIQSYVREENAVWVTINTEKSLLKYIIKKGSIAIDGISLTVAYVDDTSFKVSIIPHTGEETTLLNKKPGEELNLEADMVGKYIEKFMLFNSNENNQSGSESNIDMGFLSEHGFI
jgi:riboflavin synthase